MVNWGLLGTSKIAKGETIPGMVEAYNCNLYAIAGRDYEKTRLYKEQFSFEKMYTDYDELLDDPEVEAVYISLPNNLHVEWCIKALNKKKHVLCEKPIASGSDDMKKLIEVAKANDRYVMEAYAYLHSPVTQAIKEEIKSGILGDIKFIESEFLIPTPESTNIRMTKEQLGGALYDVGCYTTSQVLWLLEDEPANVESFAYFEKGIDLYNASKVTFKGECIASLISGMNLTEDGDFRIDRLAISGTKGSLRSDIRFNQEGDLSYTVFADGKEVTKRLRVPNNYRLEVEQMGRCILNSETPFVSNEFSVKNLSLMESILSKMGY